MSRKKVLFIGIGFYDYDQAIINEFKKLGYDVDYYSEVPKGFWYKLSMRLKFKKGIDLAVNRVNNFIVKDSADAYDLIFVIKGEFLSSEAIKKIRSRNNNGQCLLYLWDSLDRIPIGEDKFKIYDKIYSFDRVDCDKNKDFIFNPLFFRNEFKYSEDENKQDNDLFFLGWYHSDRFKLVKKIDLFCSANQLKSRLLLYTSYINYLLHSITGGELKGNKRFLFFSPISSNANVEQIRRSRVVLDVAHPSQSGLTMRTIELIGSKKKIITTNSDIVNYDFYNKNNILIIDRDKPILNKSFFETPYQKIDNSVIDYYQIDKWLQRML